MSARAMLRLHRAIDGALIECSLAGDVPTQKDVALYLIVIAGAKLKKDPAEWRRTLAMFLLNATKPARSRDLAHAALDDECDRYESLQRKKK